MLGARRLRRRHVGKTRSDRRDELCQLRGAQSKHPAQLQVVEVIRDPAQALDPRPECGDTLLFARRADRDRSAGRPCAGAELLDQPRLSDSGVAGDQNRLAVTLEHLFEDGRHAAKLVPAADEDGPARSVLDLLRCRLAHRDPRRLDAAGEAVASAAHRLD